MIYYYQKKKKRERERESIIYLEKLEKGKGKGVQVWKHMRCGGQKENQRGKETTCLHMFLWIPPYPLISIRKPLPRRGILLWKFEL